MTLFALFGALRNLLGIVLLAVLVRAGVPLSIALLLAMLVGYSLYIAQVRYTIGKVDARTIAKTFAFVYLANRALLWLVHERLGLEILYAQLISIALLTTISYRHLVRGRDRRLLET